MARKYKPRLIPEQDRRICGSICLCQLTIVLSCVAIVYLSVAIYLPSYKAFQSGFEAKPVMCQTINTTLANNCPWASCGEWCLTKTSGFCPQIHATVRRNGTDISLENCTRITTTTCPQVNAQDLKKFNCNNGSECASLDGVFNCSLGHCANMSELYLCHHKADGMTIDAEQDNMKLNGFFECIGSRCTKIKRAFSCDRYCSKITTTAVNTLIMQDDSLITADCERAFAFNEARGNEPGVRHDMSPIKIWDENLGSLLTNCMEVIRDGDKIRATDCLNGTLLKDREIPHPFMNFTQFWKIYEQSDIQLDDTQRFLPKQSTLTIYNTSRLYINLEGCVNTLRGECREFLDTHGRDGDNNTAQSRYQCFYNKEDSFLVVARFDLEKTWRDLLIAVIVPTTLFIISLTSLCIITQSVKVGDDAKMRCKYCTGSNSDQEDNLQTHSHGNNNNNNNNKRKCLVEAEPILSPSGLQLSDTEGGACGGVGTSVSAGVIEVLPSGSGTSDTPKKQKNKNNKNGDNSAYVIDSDVGGVFSTEMRESSTKSLIPLSPCTETTTEHSLSGHELSMPETKMTSDEPLFII